MQRWDIVTSQLIAVVLLQGMDAVAENRHVASTDSRDMPIIEGRLYG